MSASPPPLWPWSPMLKVKALALLTRVLVIVCGLAAGGASLEDIASVGKVGMMNVIRQIEDDLKRPVPRTGQSTSFHVPYEIRESAIEGAGLGVFAAVDIPVGSMIWENFAEDNLLVPEEETEEMRQALSVVSGRLRRQFFAWICGDDSDERMFFELDDGRYFNDAIDAASSNLRATPNALYASRPIHAGEELLEDYAGDTVFQAEWLQRFQAEFGDEDTYKPRVSRVEATEAYRYIWQHRYKMIPETECDSYTPESVTNSENRILGVRSAFAHIAILELCGRRDLYTDNNIQSSELDEFIYHEALVHPAMAAFQLFYKSPARHIFVAGGGELSVAREALRWPGLEKVVTVDIDQQLIDVIREWIPSMTGKAHQDPRSEIRVGDAVAELHATANDTYDLIISDLPDPFEMQAAQSFHSADFYRMAKSKLHVGGFFVSSTGPCNFQTQHTFAGNDYDNYEDVDSFLLLYGMLSTVFKHVDAMHIPMTTWFGDFNMYCVFVASDGGHPVGLLPATAIDTALPFPGASPESVGVPPGHRDGLGFYNGELHVAAFTKSQEARNALGQASEDASEKEDIALERIAIYTSKSVDKAASGEL